MSGLRLVSHVLCPYVQRAAIVLLEKNVPFTRVDVDLAAKPAWFLSISPLGRTPLLLVDETEATPYAQPLFESAVICEYLDETTLPRLHPAAPLVRARHRAWIEFGSTVLNDIWGFYTAPDAAAYEAARDRLAGRFAILEAALHPQGPWFAGETFSMVDAVFAPVFRYFDAFERLGVDGFFDGTPRIARWRAALADRPSVRQAVAPDFAERLDAFLLSRESELARRARQPETSL
ncbi:glutathione S-transferase family protein [Caenimonas sedimenti]|uniref:glutathione transferase n=1 Tax=Caenimonas sedimenti TaxID=2596921 RepID=A0A562ZQX1_9BURK|nr:glutathione S-transferase family protein [Caenimonas sedimenti]TWO70787.1 glutathione S-transferase family protein [Caenimonas sedimenti]